MTGLFGFLARYEVNAFFFIGHAVLSHALGIFEMKDPYTTAFIVLLYFIFMLVNANSEQRALISAMCIGAALQCIAFDKSIDCTPVGSPVSRVV